MISRSGSLSYESCQRLTRAGIGQSTVIGIGGDPVKGTTAAEALELFHADPETGRAVPGRNRRRGGTWWLYASRPDSKPVAALIVGRTAPPGKKMGHAAALVGSAADSRRPRGG